MTPHLPRCTDEITALVLGALLGGCLADFAVPMSDASQDSWTDDPAREDLVISDRGDDGPEPDGEEEADIEPPPTCGDGIVDPGEECDQTAPVTCTASCGTEGTRTCDACAWSACVPPAEICDEIDQDCNSVSDEWLWALRGQPFLVDAGGSPSLAPSVTWSGSMFSILWEDARTGEWQLFLSGIGADYSVLVPETQVTTSENDASSPSVAWDGAGLGAAWIDLYDAEPSREAYAGLFGTDGSERSARLNISGTTAPDERDVRIVWTGTGFGAAWTTAEGVHLSIIPAAMDSADTRRLNDSTEADAVCLAWSGSRFGVFWEDRSAGSRDIRGILAESDGRIASDTLELTTDPADQASPACAFGGEFVVMWQDDRSGSRAIQGSAIQTDAVVTAGEYFVTGCVGGCVEPALVWAGDSFVLAVVDEQAASRSLFLRRLGMDGASLNDDLIILQPGTAAGRPALAWSGSLLAAAFESDDGISHSLFLILAGCP